MLSYYGCDTVTLRVLCVLAGTGTASSGFSFSCLVLRVRVAGEVLKHQVDVAEAQLRQVRADSCHSRLCAARVRADFRRDEDVGPISHNALRDHRSHRGADLGLVRPVICGRVDPPPAEPQPHLSHILRDIAPRPDPLPATVLVRMPDARHRHVDVARNFDRGQQLGPPAPRRVAVVDEIVVTAAGGPQLLLQMTAADRAGLRSEGRVRLGGVRAAGRGQHLEAARGDALGTRCCGCGGEQSDGGQRAPDAPTAWRESAGHC